MATGTQPAGGRNGLPLVRGAAGGAVAFLLGYLVTFLVQSGDLPEGLGFLADALSALGVSPPAGWQVVGWYFLGAHNVGLDVSTSVAGQSSSGTVLNDLGILQTVVPVILLVFAGFLVARAAGVPDATEGAKAGLTVVPGYLVLAIVLALSSSWSFSESAAGVSASVAPELLPAVLLAGVLYPVVFGALGGAAAGGADV
ncbi:MAG: transporter [Haloarculaceae archaeon]